MLKALLSDDLVYRHEMARLNTKQDLSSRLATCSPIRCSGPAQPEQIMLATSISHFDPRQMGR